MFGGPVALFKAFFVFQRPKKPVPQTHIMYISIFIYSVPLPVCVCVCLDWVSTAALSACRLARLLLVVCVGSQMLVLFIGHCVGPPLVQWLASYPPPPPPCISYALVQATVGVGTILIWDLILIRYQT